MHIKSKEKTPDEYFESLPDERKPAMNRLRQILKVNLPAGFEEKMAYGMPSFVVPHSLYPSGYHVNPKEPLPFISIASQKNFIGLYHMGIYADEKILKWFQESYAEQISTKLDMGKSCIRFKNTKYIPYDLIAELAKKITVEDWIEIYEKSKAG